jgi:hypothetical protein
VDDNADNPVTHHNPLCLYICLSGSPLLYFGDGTCAANAICETELADYLIDCALDPNAKDMVNQTRDIGEEQERRGEEGSGDG